MTVFEKNHNKADPGEASRPPISSWRQNSLTKRHTGHSCGPYDGNKFHPPCARGHITTNY